MNIIGHADILAFFAKVIKNDNLSHAYCFVGPEAVGKRTVSEEISSQLLNIPKEKLLVQPDITIIRQEVNEKTGKTKKNIDIDQIRNVREALGRHAFLGGYKIAIIDEAEKMNISASNALLKTLEEPKSKTIIFLITKDETLLPQTIQSRCQKIYFNPVEKDILKKDLKGTTEEMLEFAFGAPGKIFDWIQNEDSFEEHKKEIKRFQDLFNSALYQKNKIVQDLYGDKTDHNATRENLIKVLGLWQTELRRMFLDKKISPAKTVTIFEKIIKAKSDLYRNIHPKLIIENILLAIP